MLIVTEYCAGRSILRILKEVKHLSEPQISSISKQVLKGLNYLHDYGKLHRDLKCANILLTSLGEVRITDFGVSAELSEGTAKRFTLIGTPYWMAPEMLEDVGYDLKADMWALGITAIEMAEGNPPYIELPPHQAAYLIPQSDPPSLANPDAWSPNFVDFVVSMLKKDPCGRPDTHRLLKHEFIVNAADQSVLLPLVSSDEYSDLEKSSERFPEKSSVRFPEVKRMDFYQSVSPRPRRVSLLANSRIQESATKEYDIGKENDSFSDSDSSEDSGDSSCSSEISDDDISDNLSQSEFKLTAGLESIRSLQDAIKDQSFSLPGGSDGEALTHSAQESSPESITKKIPDNDMLCECNCSHTIEVMDRRISSLETTVTEIRKELAELRRRK